MQTNKAVTLTIAIVVAIALFITGWVLGDIGLGFLGFVVRWILPICALIAHSMMRKRGII